GVNEFLTKPVTARGVIDRICEVVDNARPYVRAPGYFGPDRRRRADPMFNGPWRRGSDSRLELEDDTPQAQA
ncbi:MAG: response regulator, partial [Caulobacterales bacterium]|nr:response regulator [Caulobacterales bacterium]